MKVFLSWSGGTAEKVASSLHRWFDRVLADVVETYFSPETPAGVVWTEELRTAIRESAFAVLVITPDNRERPWLMWEAGALSNLQAEIRIVPFLFHLEVEELPRQLQDRQSIVYKGDPDRDRAAILKLVDSLLETAGVEPSLRKRVKDHADARFRDLVDDLQDIRPPEITRGVKVFTRPPAGGYNTRFYNYLESLLTHPKTKRCWFSGGGFDLRNEPAKKQAEKLIGAMRQALENGVDIERIHTGGRTSAAYAQMLAELASMDVQGRFTLYLLRSEGSAQVSDVFLINTGDPDWNVAEFMIETTMRREEASLASSAVFVHDNFILVRDLTERFELMRENAMRLGASQIVETLSGQSDYFAYGSNMDRDQMLRRIPAAECLGKAVLNDYRLTFDQPAKYRGGSVANIQNEPGAKVWGVVWRIPAMDLPTLDHIEDISTYDRVSVGVEVEDKGKLDCEVYVAKDPVDGLYPEKDYLYKMISGAIAAGLPGEYMNRLRHQETLEDKAIEPD